MKSRTGSQGYIKGFFTLLILVAVAYAGISFGKPYYRFNALRSYTKDILYMEIGNVESIKEKVLAEAVSLQIPLDEKDLEVTRNNKIITVRAVWSETVDFWGYYSKQLDFTLEVVY